MTVVAEVAQEVETALVIAATEMVVVAAGATVGERILHLAAAVKLMMALVAAEAAQPETAMSALGLVVTWRCRQQRQH